LAVPIVSLSRQEPRPQQFHQHTFARGEVERPEARGLSQSDAEDWCLFEFFTYPLNKFSKKHRLHLKGPGGVGCADRTEDDAQTDAGMKR
jgi:hypothetical protein